ncbi:hypothetical protein DPMN_066597 [Dreissena polymorpha]|uniref:Uncharacterized protein n=1 Tax=Dreissena polymorpha TaxID=45954 RepID=A0A9D3YY68_DREPO|nr:hypothetical protein DPMN_066597 [Dreissena polymorpha]
MIQGRTCFIQGHTVQLTQNQQIPRSAEFDDINCSRSRLGIDHLVAESPCLFAETRRGMMPRKLLLMEPHISQTREVSYANDDDDGDENDDDHDAAAAPPPPPMLLLMMMMMMRIMFNITTAFEHRWSDVYDTGYYMYEYGSYMYDSVPHRLQQYPKVKQLCVGYD